MTLIQRLIQSHFTTLLQYGAQDGLFFKIMQFLEFGLDASTNATTTGEATRLAFECISLTTERYFQVLDGGGQLQEPLKLLNETLVCPWLDRFLQRTIFFLLVQEFDFNILDVPISGAFLRLILARYHNFPQLFKQVVDTLFHSTTINQQLLQPPLPSHHHVFTEACDSFLSFFQSLQPTPKNPSKELLAAFQSALNRFLRLVRCLLNVK